MNELTDPGAGCAGPSETPKAEADRRRLRETEAERDALPERLEATHRQAFRRAGAARFPDVRRDESRSLSRRGRSWRTSRAVGPRRSTGRVGCAPCRG